jgi:hypothetical protein
MAADPQTPVFRTTTVALDKADPALAVTVTVGGQAVSFVQMTPSKAPDVGLVHTMGLNAATPVLDNPTTSTMTTMLPLEIELSDRMNLASPYRVTRVYLKAGADGTTFDVVGIL